MRLTRKEEKGREAQQIEEKENEINKKRGKQQKG